MPGFNIGGQEGPSNTTELYRTYRWFIETMMVDGRSMLNPYKLLYVKSIQLPGFNIEEEMIQGSAIKYKFAKTVNWDDVLVTFYDTEGIMEGLKSWQDLVWTPELGVQPASKYKGVTTFVLTNGEGSPTGFTFILRNCWPKSIKHGSLSYDSSEIKLVELTLSYDWAEYGTATRATR
jgi:hypothetical protein